LRRARRLALWLAVLGLGLGLAGRAHAAADPELRILHVGSQQREYVLREPALWAGPEIPLVVVLHGAGGNAKAVELQTGFTEQGDLRGFAVAYPETLPSAQGRWNAGVCCGLADDVGFLRALVDDVAKRLPIDRRRVYAAGISNGGMMAYRLACEASDSFAAVGVVAGALVTRSCAPAGPVSLIHVHGTRDDFVPLTGGPGALGITYPTTELALDFWTEHDGCDSDPTLASAGPIATVRRYSGCLAGTGVEFWELARVKHGWPPVGRRRSPLVPAAPDKFDAAGVLWEFFAAHPRPG
jgi:polyhydroxybutyrate depolymerase